MIVPSKIKRTFDKNFMGFTNKLPLEKFIPATFFVFLLCIIIMSVIIYRNIDEYQKNIDEINHTNEVIKENSNIRIGISYIPTLRREYITTGDEIFLQLYNRQKDTLFAQIKTLKILVADNPNQQTLLRVLDSLVADHIRILDNSIQIYQKTGIETPIQEEILSAVRKNIMEVAVVSQAIESEETTLLKLRTAISQRTNRNSQIFIIITSLFSFIVIGFSLYISNKLIKNKNQTEKLLIKSYDELEDKVEDRTQELKKINNKLREEITSRQKSEASLRESEKRFRTLADSAPILIWRSGADKLYNYFNKVWFDFTGRTLEQEAGNKWIEGIHPDDYHKFLDTYLTAFDKREQFEIEYRLKNSKDEYVWVLNKGVPLYEGNEFIGYIGGSIDIHERKKSEQFLNIQYAISKILAGVHTLEDASRRVVEEICHAVKWDFGILWMVENEKLIVEALWSVDKDEQIKYSLMEDRSREISKGSGLLGRVWENKTALWIPTIHKEQQFVRKNEVIAMGWNSVFATPIMSDNKVIAIIEFFNRDVCIPDREMINVLESIGRQIGNYIERKKAEEQLATYHDDLEDKVKERTVELANTLQKLINEIDEKEKIQNRLKLFAHAVRGIKECIYITDLGNNVIFVNSAFEKIYGYKEEEIKSAEIPIITEKHISKEKRKEILDGTKKGGWKGDFLTRRKDNSEFYVSLSTTTIKNEEGDIEAIIGICQDVTENKLNEDLINKRNSLLNLLNDVMKVTNKTFNLNEAIQYAVNKVCQYTSWDIGHCFLYKGDHLESCAIWNEPLSPAYKEFKTLTNNMTFAKGEGLPGQTIETGKAYWIKIGDLIDFQKYKRAQLAKSSGLATGIWIPIIKQNEAVGVLEFFKQDEFPLDNEILECLINIGLEIGSVLERVEIITKIRESEKLLIDAQHIARLGSWEWDVQSNKVSWSDELYEIYERKPGDIELNYESFLTVNHPDDIEYTKSIIGKAYLDKEPFDYFHRIVTPEGRIKTVKSTGEVFTDTDGNITRMFGTCLDVTEIKETEDKLRESEEQLRKANIKLIETQKELIHNEKLAALGRFSSGIAHEIRNPLANIRGLAQMVSRANVDEKLEKHLNYILINVDLANNIIKDLLDFASPEDLLFKEEKIDEIINNIVESIKPAFNEKNVKILLDIPDNLPTLNVDKLKLENAFLNFVFNAKDAMPDGGKITLTVRHDTDTDEMIIYFTDTGMGIPQENLDKILEPFFTTKNTGTGLGLSLAYQTIKSHNGGFNIRSAVGKGTQIEIKLPIRNHYGKNINS